MLLCTLCSDLYGLINTTSKQPIILPDVRVSNDKDEDKQNQIWDTPMSLLNNIIWENCTTVSLKWLDTAVSKQKPGDKLPKEEVYDHLKLKTLLCSAVMYVLVDTAGGNNVILATATAFQMVCDPFKFLKLNKQD